MTESRNQHNRLIDIATLKPEEPCVPSGFFYGPIAVAGGWTKRSEGNPGGIILTPRPNACHGSVSRAECSVAAPTGMSVPLEDPLSELSSLTDTGEGSVTHRKH